MGKLSAIITANNEQYIKIHDVILIIKHFSDDRVREVGIYLGQIGIFKQLPIYEKDRFLNFIIIENEGCSEDVFDYFLSGKTENTGLLPGAILGRYWKKSDILNFEPLKNLGITQAVLKHFSSYRYYKCGHDTYTPFKDFKDASTLDNNTGNPTIGHADAAHYQRERDQYKQQAEQLQTENETLKQRIAELEAQQSEKIFNQNAINNDEINLPVNDLMLIAALVGMLRNEIRVKANKSQAKILQTIEDNHKHMTGLSKSRTEKILAAANKAYKSLNNKKMK